MSGYEQACHAVESFTDIDRAQIEKITTVDFIGLKMPVGSINRFSTRAGIDQQIAEFTNVGGLVYVWERKVSGFSMRKLFVNQAERHD